MIRKPNEQSLLVIFIYRNQNGIHMEIVKENFSFKNIAIDCRQPHVLTSTPFLHASVCRYAVTKYVYVMENKEFSISKTIFYFGDYGR